MLRRDNPPISFLGFFLIWAGRQGWEVPPLHVQVCIWLEQAWRDCEPLLLVMLPRGHAKSTILEIFNAWVYYCDKTLRILHQSESNGTALKTSRGTQNVLRHHPLCVGMLPEDTGTVEQWWLTGAYARDPRNASMYAMGILSNVTSSRADFIQNDDIEVPKNIGTPEAREKLRFRLGEQVHIAVPGATKLYVGTPHTHESIYDEVKALGARCLVVPMFGKSYRIDKASDARHDIGFKAEYVFSGIGLGAQLLRKNIDYKVIGNTIELALAGGDLIDCYAEAAWPERFDAGEMLKRRQETRTINEWDSQYQLLSRPVTKTRLDPARIIPYDVQPQIRYANGAQSMWLGRERIVGASARWDPASGKKNSDDSAVAVLLHAESGRRYLHHVTVVDGEVAVFANDGKTITGGQVWEICEILERWQLPRITVETNGIGQFAPTILRSAIMQRKKINCAVVGKDSKGDKNARILGTFEPLLLSRGTLWAHVDVLNGPFSQQMRDWNPIKKDQPDDLLDSSAQAIADTPERFKATGPDINSETGAWQGVDCVNEAVFER